jgi:penicillin amidase
LRDTEGPAGNYVYADVDGHIGYQLAGRIPLREGAPPVMPVLAWDRGHEWIGEVPFDALPRLYDPPEGAIVTANARITGPNYPYHISMRWDDIPLRTMRIRELLDAKPKLSLDDVAAIQLDLYQGRMAEVATWARLAPSDDPRIERFKGALASWDLRADAGSQGAALAEAFRLELIHELFEPRLSPLVFGSYLWAGLGVHLLALERALNDPDATFFGPEPTAARAARSALVERAIRRAIDRLEARLGPDWSAWRWGRLHTATFVHPFARGNGPVERGLAWLLNIGPVEAPGSPFTVSSGFWAPARPFDDWFAPLYRQIVDLGDLSRSRYLPPPPGQAEQVASRHYRDLVSHWVEGKYLTMSWSRAQVEADAESKLVLIPPRAR